MLTKRRNEKVIDIVFQTKKVIKKRRKIILFITL